MEPLGRYAATGMMWLLANVVTTKTAHLIAQLALGWLLAPEDFGVYAIAVSIALMARALQDGGAQPLLLQRGTHAFHGLVVDVFWLALTINVTVGVGLGVASPLLADALHEPRIPSLLWIIGLSIPCGTPWAVLSAKLQLDMRWRAWALTKTLSSMVEYALMVLLAMAGFGPASLVVPLPIAVAISGLFAWRLCRTSPWRQKPTLRHWPSLLTDTRWLVFGALAAGVFAQGDYLILGRLVPAAVIGIYYFAYQIPAQIGHIAGSLRSVLFPILGRLGRDRRGEALLRGARTLMAIVAPGCIAIAVLLPRIEQLVWAGRWNAAVVPAQILAVVMPYRLLYPVPEVALLATGRFKAWSLVLLVEGFGLMIAAAVGAWIAPDPAVIAAVTGPYLAVSILTFTAFVLRRLGVPVTRLLAAVGSSWVLALAAGGVASLVGSAVGAADLVALVLEGATFTATYILLVRVLWTRSLREVVDTFPAHWQRRLNVALQLG